MNPRVRRLIVSGVLGGLILIVVWLPPGTGYGEGRSRTSPCAEICQRIEHDGTDARGETPRAAAGWPLSVPCDRANGRRAEDTIAFTIKDARITESSGLAVDPLAISIGRSTTRATRASRTASGSTERSRAPSTFVPNQKMSRPSRCTRTGSTLPTSATTTASATSFVYFFMNPRANGLTVTYHAYDFSYPDGQHNAETLLVDESGRLFIVTKARSSDLRGAGQTEAGRRQ